jgi:hypothetical protein
MEAGPPSGFVAFWKEIRRELGTGAGPKDETWNVRSGD